MGRDPRRARGADPADASRMEVFRHMFASVAEEMGVILRRTAYSPNIRERRDYSCAVFDAQARLIAQAEHIPVHLGAMPLSVEACVRRLDLAPGDVAILNDPYQGGTHLPDITFVSPVFVPVPQGSGRGSAAAESGEALLGYVASRAHHADVGGTAPGSMSLAGEIFQEGLIIPPVKLVRGGSLERSVWDLLLANVRTPDERAGDLRAQLAAGKKGAERLTELVARYGKGDVRHHMAELFRYTERATRALIGELPDGAYEFRDRLDPVTDRGERPEIRVRITIRGEEAVVDFTGTSPESGVSLNAVRAVTISAVAYVFRALMQPDVPSNGGCLVPIRVIAPEGTLVNARRPAAVAAGNVETSQRIVDTLLGALARACPDRVPAASQGTMNNLSVGGHDPRRQAPFTYYETLGGGSGGRANRPGQSGIHTHMTNTMNTPVEAIEYAYPLRIWRYALRDGSGGAGQFRGGDGICREYEFLAPARVTLLCESRVREPYGLAGGSAGAPGTDLLVRGGREQALTGRTTIDARPGDVLIVRTPGGGGHGRVKGRIRSDS